MIPFYIVVCLIPLSLYCGILAIFAARRSPRILSRTSDSLLLALGLAGFVFIGPIQLLVPIHSLVDKHAFAWILAMALYFLFVSLSGRFTRPRCVLYHISEEQVRDLVSRTALRFGPECPWLGPVAGIDALHLHLLVRPTSWSQTAMLSALGPCPSRENWLAWCQALREEAATVRSRSVTYDRAFAAMSLLLFLSALLFVFVYRVEVLEGVSLFFFP